MDIANLEFQIGELKEHVKNLHDDLLTGKMKEDDWPDLAIQLGHILDHVCLAWNLRNLKIEDFSSMSDLEFENASNSVPNFGNTRILSNGEL